MKIDSEKKYDIHVLVCTNKRDNGKADCASKGSEQILAQLKQWSKTQDFKGKKVRINKSGCLDRCAEGAACVMYPQGEWVLNAEEKDIPAIQEWIRGQVRS